MIAYHCSLDGCDTWTKSDREPGFMYVNLSMKKSQRLYFCSIDHAGRYLLSISEPTEEI